MNVELVFNKQTMVPYTTLDGVCGFLLAHRLRPCCGLCGCGKVSLVASRFMSRVLGDGWVSKELVAATFNHLNEKEQNLILKLLPQPTYSGLLEVSKKIWSYSMKNPEPEETKKVAPEVVLNQPTPGPSAQGKSDAELQQVVTEIAHGIADDMLRIDNLMRFVKPDQVVLKQQLNQLHQALEAQFREDLLTASNVNTQTRLSEITKKLINDPNFNELRQFMFEYCKSIAPDLVEMQLIKPPANSESPAPVVNSQAQSAAPVVSLPIEASTAVSVEKTPSPQPTHHYNLRPRKPAK
jgi:hypothetical protein